MSRREFFKNVASVVAAAAALPAASGCDSGSETAFDVLVRRGGEFTYVTGASISGLVLTRYEGETIPFRKYGNIASGDRIFIIAYNGQPIEDSAAEFIVPEPRLLTVKRGRYAHYTV